jgi:hypothetical protein
MSFLQIKLLEAEIASLCHRELEGKDEFSEYRQTTEAVRYKLEKKIIKLQEEYVQLDDKFKQVGL